ncbi:hypothetical protein EDD15DRAFT_2371295 [Pisolithus albus]|nr:hypothetical protein EDD15DRAFT_2371295 [Pisolithus albus]
MYISVLKGLMDLVFNPPPNPTPQFSSTSANATAPSAMCPLPLYPETTYLDSARLLVLAADAADTAAMYMFLLLYRQLIFSNAGDPAVTRIIPDNSDGAFGGRDYPADDKWCKIKRDIVLQVALRAEEFRGNASSQLAGSNPSSTVNASSVPYSHPGLLM